jgi:hypothetical protein
MQTSRLILVAVFSATLGVYGGYCFYFWHERDPANMDSEYYRGACNVLKKQTADEIDKINRDLNKEFEDSKQPYGIDPGCPEPLGLPMILIKFRFRKLCPKKT